MSLDDIKKLRETTGAGMVDCQKALDEAGGDLTAAVDILRKKGLEKAGKKAERATSEGMIAMAREGKKVAVASLRCETDFVARNSDFGAAVAEFASQLLTVSADEFKTWAEEKIKNELIVKIGENLQLGDFGVLEGDVVGVYLHSDKKQAAVVVLSGGTAAQANDLAMQVVAMSPSYIRPEDVPAEVIAKEKEIYVEQMAGENKPAEVLQKIIEGKLQKFYMETCLLKQPFIKDDSQTVEQCLGNATVNEFQRYSI
ncbi:elongation factor Ts [Candidatus Falkowbacteria bacterium]|nr:elongation factor Ts [Candidatus Falkowbacteria bacterium]